MSNMSRGLREAKRKVFCTVQHQELLRVQQQSDEMQTMSSRLRETQGQMRYLRAWLFDEFKREMYTHLSSKNTR